MDIHIHMDIYIYIIKFDRRVRIVMMRFDISHELVGEKQGQILQGVRKATMQPLFFNRCRTILRLSLVYGAAPIFLFTFSVTQECMNGDLTRTEKKNLRVQQVLDK